MLLLQETQCFRESTDAAGAVSTEPVPCIVRLEPGQLQELAVQMQGNTYALLGLLFMAVMVLSMIYLNTLLR